LEENGGIFKEAAVDEILDNVGAHTEMGIGLGTEFMFQMLLFERDKLSFICGEATNIRD